MSGLQKVARRVPALLVIAAGLLLAMPAVPAGAHAGYVRSVPADGAILAASPTQVDVYFSQEMARKSGLPSLIVVNDIGDKLDLGSKLDDNDRKHVYTALPPELPDGRYTVIWHTLSDEDGEEAQGAFHFYIGAGPAAATPAAGSPTPQPVVQPSPSPAPSATGGGSGSDVPVWGLALGIVAGVGAGGGAGLVLGRRFGQR